MLYLLYQDSYCENISFFVICYITTLLRLKYTYFLLYVFPNCIDNVRSYTKITRFMLLNIFSIYLYIVKDC